MNATTLNVISEINLCSVKNLELTLLDNIIKILSIENGLIDFTDDNKFNEDIVCGFMSEYRKDDPYFDWVDKVSIKDGIVYVTTSECGLVLLDHISNVMVLSAIIEVYLNNKI